jgi:hypothetical protein
VRSRPATTLRPAPAALPRPVPAAPLDHPIGGGHFHEASTRVHAIHPSPRNRLAASPEPGTPAGSRRSSPRPPPPDGTRPASAFTPGFAPRSYPRRTPERRQALAHWPGYYTLDISRTSKRRLPLDSSTLTSHVIPGRLHHHRGHLPAPQPVRQRQHLPFRGAEAAGLAPGSRPTAPGWWRPSRPCRCRCRTPGPGTAAHRSPLPCRTHLTLAGLLACEAVPPGEPGACGRN